MRKQYGTIPFVREDGKIKVVMITSASGYWIFPKGQYEEDEGKAGTAAMESMEEAGVEGRILKNNAYRTKVFIKSGEEVHLTLYAMKVDVIHDQWEEDHRRERKVLNLKEAKKLISSDELLKCLKKFERDFAE